MDLIEIEQKRTLSREDAAAWLREVADHLSRHNDIEFEREGLRYTVDVPDVVTLEYEIEIEQRGGSLEIEVSW